ncbi:mitochondrial carrier [Atractiella rhizophila]|nr:mitochondrial carrier [Atractiella rhizophila]
MPNKSYPFYYGGIAASLAGACTHPLDVAKVRMQTSSERSLFRVVINSVRQYGLKTGAYAGLSASLLRQMTYSLTRFGAYDVIKERMAGAGDSNKLPAYKVVAAGALAGGLGGIAGNGADVVLVRMIGDVNRPPEKQYKYRNCFVGVYRILREEGPGSLFTRGLGPNIARAVLMSSCQLGTYDIFKRTLGEWLKEGPVLHFSASFLAGTVATTVCSPFDVLRTRIMSGSGSHSILDVLRYSFKNEGARWMFRGWTPAWIRLTPQSILIFLIFEQMKVAHDKFLR